MFQVLNIFHIFLLPFLLINQQQKNKTKYFISDFFIFYFDIFLFSTSSKKTKFNCLHCYFQQAIVVAYFEAFSTWLPSLYRTHQMEFDPWKKKKKTFFQHHCYYRIISNLLFKLINGYFWIKIIRMLFLLKQKQLF